MKRADSVRHFVMPSPLHSCKIANTDHFKDRQYRIPNKQFEIKIYQIMLNMTKPADSLTR